MSDRVDPVKMALEILEGKIGRRSGDAIPPIQALQDIVKRYGKDSRVPLLKRKALAQVRLQSEGWDSANLAKWIDTMAAVDELLELFPESDSSAASAAAASADADDADILSVHPRRRTPRPSRRYSPMRVHHASAADLARIEGQVVPTRFTGAGSAHLLVPPAIRRAASPSTPLTDTSAAAAAAVSPCVRVIKDQKTGEILTGLRRDPTRRAMAVLDFDGTIGVNVQTLEALIEATGGDRSAVAAQIREKRLEVDADYPHLAVVSELCFFAELDIPTIVVTRRSLEGVREVEAVVQKMVPHAQIFGTIDTDGRETEKSVIIKREARRLGVDVIHYFEDSEAHRQEVCSVFEVETFEMNIYQVDLESEITGPIIQRLMQ
jgi:hypothetical protein